MRVEEPPALSKADGRSPLARLGQGAIVPAHHTGGLLFFAPRALGMLLFLRADLAETIRHTARFGLRSLPLVLTGAVLVGGVVGMQGLGYVRRYNATEVFGWAAGLSSFREVAPLLLSLLLAARVGAKNTAELASMRARERLDALVALGLDPERVVLGPRVWAITLSAGILFPLATTTVLASAFLLAWALGDQRLSVSVYSMMEYLPHTAVLQGLARLVVFGFLIAVASTYFGALAPSGRDARSVGRAVYASSVTSMTAIVIVNLSVSFLSSLSS